MEFLVFNTLSGELSMKFRMILGLGVAVALSSHAFAADGDKPADKPEAKADVKGVRLTKPFSELKDLTPEQTAKIKEIHKKYLAEIKATEAKQLEEEMAVLTDAQKKEVAAMPPAGKRAAKPAADKPADPKPPADAK